MSTLQPAAAPPDQLLGEPTARDLMRTSVLTIDAAESAVMAYALTRRQQTGIAVVLRDGHPVGLVDKHRLRRAALRALINDEDGNEDCDTTVGSCLPQRCVRIPVEAPLGAVAERLLDSPVGAALAMDAGKPVGVITTADLLGALQHPSRRRGRTTGHGRPALHVADPVPATGSDR